MAKKDFASDLQNFVKKPEATTETKNEEKPRKVGRPKEHETYEKTTVTFPAEMMGKLRVLCLYEGKQIREILTDALGRYIDEYEQEHGAIRIPPRFKEK